MADCDKDQECDINPGTVTPKRLPKQGAGGHEIVTALPEVGEEGVEYILFDDLTDCETFQGSFVYNTEAECWASTSTGGGGGGANYTFEDALDDDDNVIGWVAKKDGNVIYEHTDNCCGGGSGELEQDITVSNPLGRYAMGDTISAGTSFETIFRALLTNVYYPTLTNPSMTFTYTMPTYAEVGTSIPARSATLTLNRGSINPQYTAESPYRSGEATNYAIASTGADTEYSDSSTSSGSFSVNSLSRSTKGTIKLTATISYAAGVQPKDSDGNDYDSPLPAGSVTLSKTVTFILPFYHGKTAGTSISDFTGLVKDVSAKGQKTYTYTTNNEHMVIAYDSTYGNLSAIIDSNGFDVTDGWTKSTLSVGGFTYNVYIADLATTDTNAAFTFKF